MLNKLKKVLTAEKGQKTVFILDLEYKDEAENIEKQALYLMIIATDKDQYKGIIGN